MSNLMTFGSPESSDDDVVSVTSTVLSEPREEYPLEAILAERTVADHTEYLVKWEGYPDERCTWETRSNFQDDNTMFEWETRKMRIDRGLQRPYDVSALEDKVETWIAATEKRKSRRRAKRLRLGLTVATDESEKQIESSSNLQSGEDEMDLDSPPRNWRSKSPHELPKPDQKGEYREDVGDSLVWTPLEERCLKEGIERVQGPHWNQILILFGQRGTISNTLSSRRPLDLKRKVRNLLLAFQQSGRDIPTWLQLADSQPKVDLSSKHMTKSLKQVSKDQITALDDEDVSTDDSLMEDLRIKELDKTHRKTQKPAKSRAEGVAKSSGVIKAPNLVAQRVPSVSNQPPSTRIEKPPAKASYSGTINEPSRSAGRGPARIDIRRRPSGATARPKVTGAAVMSNWNAKKPVRQNPPVRQSSTNTGGKAPEIFSKLSTKRKIEKRGRNEPPPNLDDLTLFSVKTRQPIKKTSTTPLQGLPSKSPFEMILEQRQSRGKDIKDMEMDADAVDSGGEDLMQIDSVDSHDQLAIQSTPQPQLTSSSLPATLTGPPSNAPKGPSQSLSRRPSIPLKTYTQRSMPMSSSQFESPSPSGREGPDVIATILIGHDTRVIGDVRLRDLDGRYKRLLLASKVGSKLQLRFKDIVGADDYRNHFNGEPEDNFGVGHVVPFSNTADAVDDMTHTLKTYVAGALLSNDEFAILMYPTGCDFWSYLVETLPPVPASSGLRFLMRRPFPALNAKHNDSSATDLQATEPSSVDLLAPKQKFEFQDGEPNIGAVFRALLDVKHASLIPPVTKPTQDPNTFFLMYGKKHEKEHDMVVRYLAAYNATIYSTFGEIEGAWDYFLNHVEAGVVIIHESFYWYHLIPGLARLLHRPMNIFSLTFNPPRNEPFLNRLFPHGGALLLTDSLILLRPRQCVRILNWFRHYVLGTKPAQLWKVVTRPRIRDFILGVIENREMDIGHVYVEIYEIIYYILPFDMMEHPEYETPVDEAAVQCCKGISTIDESVGKEGLDVEAIFKNDAAIVDWFAGWAMTKLEKHRRFHVVSGGRPGDVRQGLRNEWAKKWNHLEVMTAEECIKNHRIAEWETEWLKKEEARKARREERKKLEGEAVAA